MHRQVIFAAMSTFLLAVSVLAGSQFEADFQSAFPEKEFCGVFEEIGGNWKKTVNPTRAKTRFSPCSTFKIPNTVFSLTHKVATMDSKFIWDGVEREREELNRDLTLKEAYTISALWVYQILATRIGPTRMKEDVARLKYGNQDTSGGITRFWLKSSLKISAVEQKDLMKKLWSSSWPFPKSAQESVKQIMVFDQGPGWKYMGKTGSSGEGLAWWVGYAVSGKNVVVFAINGDKKGLNGPEIRKRARGFMIKQGWLPKSAIERVP